MYRQRPTKTSVSSLTLDELLSQSSWFVELDELARKRVRADANERTVEMGASLGPYGEPQKAWFGVIEGLVKWSITEVGGRTVTLGGQSMGSWFGEGTLIRNEPRQSDLIALRDCRIALVSQATFDWLRKNYPCFNEFLLKQVNERLHWFMGNFAASNLFDTDHQVARALVGLTHPSLNPKCELHLPLFQEELANLAGVSRQTCNNALRHLTQAQMVRSEYGGITVLDRSGLLTLAHEKNQSRHVCAKRC